MLAKFGVDHADLIGHPDGIRLLLSAERCSQRRLGDQNSGGDKLLRRTAQRRGDFPDPAVEDRPVDGAVAAARHLDLRVALVGRSREIEEALAPHDDWRALGIEIVEAPDVVLDSITDFATGLGPSR